MTPLQTYALAHPVVVPMTHPDLTLPHSEVQYDPAGIIVRQLWVEQPEGLEVPRWHAMLAMGIRQGPKAGKPRKFSGVSANERHRLKRLCLELLVDVGTGDTRVERTIQAWHAFRTITGAEQNVLPIGWLVARADRAT